MPKKIKNCFYKNLTFEKMLKAHERASKNKNNKYEVIKFNINLENNIINIMNTLKNNKYKTGRYKEFTIYEPKERLIKALPYKDRIIQQWYIEEFIKPYVLPRFISTTYACIDNRGTHKAVDNLQKYMKIMKRKYKNYYILKCDIKKFFYNIDKNILYNIMSSIIEDKLLLQLTSKFIYDDKQLIGIPIGNYTSQYFANIYLSKLDYYIKQELKIKYYVRYMDDFILLLNNKEQARNVKLKINNFLNKELKLELNIKTKYYPGKMGIDFCGYRIFVTHRLIRKRSKKQIKKKIQKWNNLYNMSKLDKKKVIMSFNSWIAHSSHADTYNLQRKMYNSILFNNDIKIKSI